MTLFRERDKRVVERRCTERNPLVWGPPDLDSPELETVVDYTASVREVCERLRIMGFTLEKAMADFEHRRAAHVSYLKEINEGRNYWDDEIALFEESTFEGYLDAFRDILASRISRHEFSEKRPDASRLAKMVARGAGDLEWGFPCGDIRFLFRALIEVVPPSAMVTQDLTELVGGGYYEVGDEVCEACLEELKGDYSINSRILLLSEGSTDNAVLRASIELLYPHLSDYYSFMDLAVRAPGGAGSLVHVVKAFAGAGIENRTVALFDNDAAGHSAVSLLKDVKLPPHIRAVTYPDIPFAAAYPTLGPGGSSIIDVNGSACSIELYFGKDVLTRDGTLVPVHWKGYDERVKRYQGEIREKDLLRGRFFEKIAAAKRNGVELDPEAWGDMRRLLEAVFDTF
jgi:hypothetical protein